MTHFAEIPELMPGDDRSEIPPQWELARSWLTEGGTLHALHFDRFGGAIMSVLRPYSGTFIEAVLNSKGLPTDMLWTYNSQTYAYLTGEHWLDLTYEHDADKGDMLELELRGYEGEVRQKYRPDTSFVSNGEVRTNTPLRLEFAHATYENGQPSLIEFKKSALRNMPNVGLKVDPESETKQLEWFAEEGYEFKPSEDDLEQMLLQKAGYTLATCETRTHMETFADGHERKMIEVVITLDGKSEALVVPAEVEMKLVQAVISGGNKAAPPTSRKDVEAGVMPAWLGLWRNVVPVNYRQISAAPKKSGSSACTSDRYLLN